MTGTLVLRAPSDRRSRRRATRLVVAASLLIALLQVVYPASARAADVGACNPWHQSQYPYVCVGASTGSKNYSNRTQWVGEVAVRTALEPWKFEAWIGDGPSGVAWYRTASGVTYMKWTVNRWVKNGSGICGAYHHRYGGRSVACITIKV